MIKRSVLFCFLGIHLLGALFYTYRYACCMNERYAVQKLEQLVAASTLKKQEVEARLCALKQECKVQQADALHLRPAPPTQFKKLVPLEQHDVV